MMLWSGREVPEDFIKLLEVELRLGGSISYAIPRHVVSGSDSLSTTTHFVSNGRWTRAFCGAFCAANLDPINRNSFKFCGDCLWHLLRRLEKDGHPIVSLTESGESD